MVLAKPPQIVAMSNADESMNWLIYGNSGVGKTVMGGSPDGCLILATEAGTISAKRTGSTAEVWPIEKWEDLLEALSWLKRGGWRQYRWVTIDSITEMQDLAKRWILETQNGINPDRDIDIPQLQDHQKWQNMMKRLVKDFCKLKCNVLFTALPMNVETQEGDEMVMPMLEGGKGKISQYMCGCMSAVACLRQAKVKRDGKVVEVRRLHLDYKAPYFAKNRYGLPSYLDDTSMPEIEKLVAANGATPVRNSRPRTRTTNSARKTRATAK